MTTVVPTAADHARWQAARIAELTKADGWLTLVGLHWLAAGEQSVGSDGACAVHLPHGPALLGAMQVQDGRVHWRPAGGEPQVLQTDVDGKPTVVHQGSLSFFAIERDGRLAVRVKDSEAPARRNFKGIAGFPFDPAWCVEARWDGHRAHFDLAGQACSLAPRNATERTWQFVFGDLTSGGATYGGGRFLFTPMAQGEVLMLDFNRAINPPCVFTPFAVCPLPTPDNRLPVAVTAGEKVA